MKIALLGRSPLALETALRFHFHGAALTWFMNTEELPLFSFIEESYTSDLGLKTLQEMNKSCGKGFTSWEEWISSYEKPLVDFLKAHQEVKTEEVVSVTKRFLAPGESIPGKTRFYDLFRVIYKVNPEDFIQDQKDSNPETYKRLTEEFVSSLASSIEMYQDYDLILDMRSSLSKSSIAASGRALGESRNNDKISYGLHALKKAKELLPDPALRELALIGTDSLGAETLLSLRNWLQDERSRLFIITTEEEPFKEVFQKTNKSTAEALKELFRKQEEQYQQDADQFTKKLREWQELDDFVQVKIPRPVEPIPQVNFFSGHNVSAVDELIDRRRMFITLEKPDFRNGLKHPENNYLDLKTLGADHILVTHTKKDFSFIALDAAELGYFEASPSAPNDEKAWEKDLTMLEGIEDEIFKLFSPVDSH